MTTSIQHRRGTAAQATTANEVLKAGQLGVETDTGEPKIGDGTRAWKDLPYLLDGVRRLIYSQVEASGDSFAFSTGGSDGSGMTERTAGLLGGLEVTNRAIGGAVASWSQSSPPGGGVGDGGYAKVANDLGRRTTSTGGAPYLSKSSLVLTHYGFNDLFVATGAGDGTAAQGIPGLIHAHRRIISNYLGVQLRGITDPSWTLGSGWAYQGATLYGFENACIANANATASNLTIAVPSDFPGGTVAVAGFAFNGDVGTASFKVDGGTAQTLDLSKVPSPQAGKATGWVKRLTGLAPGAHTITISGTGIAGQFGLAVDTWWIEVPDPPTVLVVGCPKFNSAIGSPYITASGQGYRSVTTLNAAMDALNAALVALVAEFGATVRYVDIDTPFNRQAIMFSSEDKLHPSDLGHATIALACALEALKVPGSASLATAWKSTPGPPRTLRQLKVQQPVTAAASSPVAAVNAHTPVNATSAAVTIALPASAKEGSTISIGKTDATTNTVTVSGSIGGQAGQTLVFARQHDQVLLIADSSGSWWKIGGSTAPGTNADPVAETPGASPWTRPAKTYREFVFFSGGTITSIKLGNTTVAAGTNVVIPLEPGDTPVVTYSGTVAVSSRPR